MPTNEGQPMYRWTCVISLLILLLLCLPGYAAVAEDERESVLETAPGRDESSPRVALVLSGGGARGAAHLGVIKVLEELRVPVDMIIGTSGGAIVGGLYASGWSPDEIEHWLDNMDWDVALADRLPRRRLAYRDKQDDERFLFELEIGFSDGQLSLPQGLIEGRNLAFILEQASFRVAEIEDFDRLPIPFRAIATDMETGKKVSIDKGRLSHAIRASMAVPGVFSPVVLNGRVLSDGGLVANLPVETALEMGADIIIAVDVGAKLLEQDRLGDIFALSGQVTTLITYQNTQRAKGLLESRDVLIQPDLKSIGSEEFPRSMEAVGYGEHAARRRAEALSALSVSEADFADFLMQQRRDGKQRGKLKEIRISGLERLSERRITTLMESAVGEPVAIERLQSDIGRLQRLGEIEALDFRIVEEEEELILELAVRERPEGPHHLRMGLEMFDEFDGSARYNVRFGHVRSSLNRLGAEWRNEVQIGQLRAIRTEFYQPLSPRERFFLSLPVHHEADTFYTYEESQQQAEFSRRETRVGLDGGITLGPHGEWRLGAFRGRISSDARIGESGAGELERELGGWRSSLNYDRLDDAEWPSEGQFLRVNWEQQQASMGADQEYRLATAQYAQFWPMDRNRVMFGLEWGESDAPLPFQQHLEIGGPFSLSGYRRGELRGERVGALRLLWLRQVASAGIAGRGGALYVGGGLSSGGAWRHGQGVGSSEVRHGGMLFVGAGTPLGPVVFGVTQSDADNRGFFLTLGLPIHRPRPDPSTW